MFAFAMITILYVAMYNDNNVQVISSLTIGLIYASDIKRPDNSSAQRIEYWFVSPPIWHEASPVAFPTELSSPLNYPSPFPPVNIEHPSTICLTMWMWMTDVTLYHQQFDSLWIIIVKQKPRDHVQITSVCLPGLTCRCDQHATQCP